MHVLTRAALCLFLLATPARADQADAKELYRQATVHFSLGRFSEAAAEYEAAFEKYPDPVILYNIAQSYRLAGNKEKALFFYRSYLQRNPKAANRPEVEERILALHKLVTEEKQVQERPPNNAATPETHEKEKPAPAAHQEPAPAPPPRTERKTPVYKKWWLWTVVGVVVAGGVAVGVGVGLSSQPGHFSTNLPTGGPGTSGLTIKY